MFAYSPNRTKITSVKQVTPGNARISEGTFDPSAIAPGHDHYDFDGGTDMDWDGQKDAIEHGERIFVDDDENEFPESSLVYLTFDLDDPDAELGDDVEKIFKAAEAAYDAWSARKDSRSYILCPPDGGWRPASSFDAEEKELLRPVAETIAMLSGDAFFGVRTDSDGNDLTYEEYLPQAAALYQSAGSNASLTSIATQFTARRKPS